jgi:hypothetical protein
VTQICILLASRDLESLDLSDPVACASNVLSMRIRFTDGTFRKGDWLADIADDIPKISHSIASGHAVAVLTNISELEADYSKWGAVPREFSPDCSCLIQLIKAAVGHLASKPAGGIRS